MKVEPMAAMLAHFPGEVVGTHPLFGPGDQEHQGPDRGAVPGAGGALAQLAA